ncbi:hypothetical protein KXR94_20395 [Stutzerimonas stutzeri]
MAVESASRALACFRAEGMLGLRGKEVEIRDLPRLHEVACSRQFRRSERYRRGNARSLREKSGPCA